MKVSQLIVKLQNLKDKLKVKITLKPENSDYYQKKIKVIMILIKKLRKNQLELEPEFKSHIESLGFEPIVEEIELLTPYI